MVWDETKVDDASDSTGSLPASEWNAHVADQKGLMDIAGTRTGSNLIVAGSVDASSVSATNIIVTGSVEAGSFSGYGGNLTGISSDGPIANTNFYFTNLITNTLNNYKHGGSAILYEKMVADSFATDTSDEKLGFVYTGGSYTNLETTGSLVFNNLLSARQKALLSGSEQTVLLYVTGLTNEDVVSVGSNYSFEDWTGSSFNFWNQTTGTFTVSQSSTTGVTLGSYATRSTKTSTSASVWLGSFSQSVDLTNINRVYVDVNVSWNANDGPSTDRGASGSLIINGSITTLQQVDAGTIGSTLSLDTTDLVGTYDVILGYAHNTSPGITNSRTSNIYFDYVRYLPGTYNDATQTFAVSANGSSEWETVNNGELITLSSVITDLGIKITDTKPVVNGDMFNGFGILYS